MLIRIVLLFTLTTAACKTSNVSNKQQAPEPKQPKVEIKSKRETVTPQGVILNMFPNASEKAKTIDCFRSLKPAVSMDTVVKHCGRPDDVLGSGIYIFVWNMSDGSTVSIGTSTLDRIGDVRLSDPSGHHSSILRRQ